MFEHTPVLLQEAIEYLHVKPRRKYIDATVGAGGHALEIVKRGGEVLGIDRDRQSLERLKLKIRDLRFETCKLKLVYGNFKDIKKIAIKHKFDNVNAILFDLGLSSWQIDKSGRGFTYLREEPLDMRINNKQKITAEDIVNLASREELYEIFTKFSEEQHSWRIADFIFRARPLRTVLDLRRVIESAVSADKRKATARIFQALRIAVNRELENLKKALPQALELLVENGRLAVISFHSLEDRIVKQKYREWEQQGKGQIITKKPIQPLKEEIKRNPRSHSAKLRVFKKNGQTAKLPNS